MKITILQSCFNQTVKYLALFLRWQMLGNWFYIVFSQSLLFSKIHILQHFVEKAHQAEQNEDKMKHGPGSGTKVPSTSYTTFLRIDQRPLPFLGGPRPLFWLFGHQTQFEQPLSGGSFLLIEFEWIDWIEFLKLGMMQ